MRERYVSHIHPAGLRLVDLYAVTTVVEDAYVLESEFRAVEETNTVDAECRACAINTEIAQDHFVGCKISCDVDNEAIYGGKEC